MKPYCVTEMLPGHLNSMSENRFNHLMWAICPVTLLVALKRKGGNTERLLPGVQAVLPHISWSRMMPQEDSIFKLVSSMLLIAGK